MFTIQTHLCSILPYVSISLYNQIMLWTIFFTGKLIIIFYDAIIILIGVILEKPFRNIENVEQWTLFLVISIRNIIDNIQYYTLEYSGCFQNNEIDLQYSNTNRDNTSCSYHLSFQQIFDSFCFYISIFYFKLSLPATVSCLQYFILFCLYFLSNFT